MARIPRFKLIKDLVALALGQLSSKLLGVVAFAYLARVLDPEDYGAVEYAIALAVIFGTIIEAGLGPIGAREIAALQERAMALGAQIPALRLVLAMAAIPAMGLFASWSEPRAQTEQLIWLYALAMFALPWKQDWLLQGLELMSAVALAQIIRMGAFAIGVVLLVDGPNDLVLVGAIEIVAASSGAAYYLAIQRAKSVPVRLAFPVGQLRLLLARGLPIGLTSMVWALMQYAPLVLLANLGSATETGWFAAPHRLIVSLLALSWIYHFNLYPVISRRLRADPEAFSHLLGASFRIVAWAGTAAALPLAILGGPILVAIFGDAFAAGGPSFALIIWTFPITLLSDHARWALIAAARVGPVLRLSILLAPAAVAALAAIAAAALGGGWAGAIVAAFICIVAAPVVDRQLLPDLRVLAEAKSDFSPSAPTR
jgi:O-antigen/teichoic acid export membrane protein